MKEIITPIKYEAIDGTVFSTKVACEDYEMLLKALEDFRIKRNISEGRLIICWNTENRVRYTG